MIYIVRHGQTDLNSRQLLQGRSDYPLNENGVRQAQEAAVRLRGVAFSRVFTSPLVRAVQTAQILAPGVIPDVDEKLIEMDYGPYEGTDLTHLPPEVITFFSDFVHNRAPEGMEPLEAVVCRAGEFMEKHCRTGENILISTHAIAMKGILEYLTPESKGAWWSKYIGNCAVYITEYRQGQFSVPEELGLDEVSG